MWENLLLVDAFYCIQGAIKVREIEFERGSVAKDKCQELTEESKNFKATNK